ncbi:MAG: FliM/FliN family flagellar motor switch protein [Planctomycetes bacterium]|nr:FliM/FliN family flagellar motor switch protein [Planctomycetota bacterium]
MSQLIGDVVAANRPSPRPAKAVHTLTEQEKLRNLLSLEVPVSVILAERDMDIESILKTKIGTIIEFDVPFDSDLMLYVADEQVARGQAVKIGENFGIRVTSVKSVEERVQALGSA